MIKLISTIISLFFCCGSVFSQYNVLDSLNVRIHDSELKSVYVAPKRVVWRNGDVKNIDYLLKQYSGQLSTNSDNYCTMTSTQSIESSIVLDYGKELQGGLLIAAPVRNGMKPAKIRVRFGESVSEVMSNTNFADSNATATNDHAMRDFEMELPWLGETRVGNTGFRFVRIDFLNKTSELKLAAVQAIFTYRDIPYLGSFESDNKRLNKIWETGAYTVHLNMQDNIWDGIKRDRLVWVGDLHPELMSINSVFGAHRLLNKTLDYAKNNTPLPGWMNGMCSYSLWWLISHRDLYMYQGDKKYLLEQKEYMSSLLKQVISNVKNGKESLEGGTRFLDWPTSRNKDVIHSGLQGLTIMALQCGEQLSSWMREHAMAQECKKTYSQMLLNTPPHHNNKQAAAIMALAGLENALKMSKSVIEREGANDFSTFYGYYMLEAMAEGGRYTQAMDIISNYWGAMLDLGATTFWEDLDYKKSKASARIDELVPQGAYDDHAQGGDFCYKGHRHSLCHGWASGPTAWLSRYVLGIEPIEAGFSKVKIKPNLGSLKWVKGTFPTPKGIIHVEHRQNDNGTIESKITLPKGITRVN